MFQGDEFIRSFSVQKKEPEIQGISFPLVAEGRRKMFRCPVKCGHYASRISGKLR